jgi:hypothetical protein
MDRTYRGRRGHFWFLLALVLLPLPTLCAAQLAADLAGTKNVNVIILVAQRVRDDGLRGMGSHCGNGEIAVLSGNTI